MNYSDLFVFIICMTCLFIFISLSRHPSEKDTPINDSKIIDKMNENLKKQLEASEMQKQLLINQFQTASMVQEMKNNGYLHQSLDSVNDNSIPKLVHARPTIRPNVVKGGEEGIA